MLKALPPVRLAHSLIQPVMLVNIRERNARVRERNAERQVGICRLADTAMNVEHPKTHELVHEVVQGTYSEHEGGPKYVGYVNRARRERVEMFAERDELPRALHVFVELIKRRLHRPSAQ